jgi:hypothetical protein
LLIQSHRAALKQEQVKVPFLLMIFHDFLLPTDFCPIPSSHLNRHLAKPSEAYLCHICSLAGPAYRIFFLSLPAVVQASNRQSFYLSEIIFSAFAESAWNFKPHPNKRYVCEGTP